MAKSKKLSFVNKQRSKKSFLPPGTIEPSSDKQQEQAVITCIRYNQDFYEEKIYHQLSDIEFDSPEQTILWIHIGGINNTPIIERIGNAYNIHPLTLEDITNTDQRPKFEDYESYIVAVMKMLSYDTELHGEQLFIILKNNIVISFLESNDSDTLTFVRKRIKEGQGRFRKLGADYLCYAIVDNVVDNYFNILEKIGDKIELIDSQIIIKPMPDTLLQLHSLKREMIHLRKLVWPMRDMVNSLERSDTIFIQPSTDLYLRDVQDHIIRVIETVENYRDLINGMMEIYLSSISNKMNEIMKVLTIISTLFIPVTFIAGVYGMNFENMPELHSRYGYTVVWIIMLAVMISLLYYFRRKKWL